MTAPKIIPRSEHRISRKDMSPAALHVLQRLSHLNYQGFLVGGGVRDLFLGKEPKDFDVGTDARPSRLKRIFRNCRIIGRRFRIAHVYFPDGEIIEVATFRQSSPGVVKAESGVILRDNEFGTPEQDACRRDLTINGLFYDIATFSVIDYVGGVEDLKNQIVRTIADPDVSFREDPVRMIRATRHAVRLGFTIEENTRQAIYRNRGDIVEANPARLLEEILKDLRSGAAYAFFASLLETHLLDGVLPALARQLRETGPDHPFWTRLQAIDRRTAAGESFSNAVYLSVLLHTLIFTDPKTWNGASSNPPNVWGYVSANLRDNLHGFRVSRRDRERISQIVISLRKLRQAVERGKLSAALLHKGYVPEALEFLQLDLEAQGLETTLIESWRREAAALHEQRRKGGGDEGDGPGHGDHDGQRPGGRVQTRKKRRRRRRRRGEGAGRK